MKINYMSIKKEEKKEENDKNDITIRTMKTEKELPYKVIDGLIFFIILSFLSLYRFHR